MQELKSQNHAPLPPALRPWQSAVILGVLGLGMLAWSWLAWPDVVIDFGTELYVPWQIVSGKVPYVDMIMECGPFSGYFNALLFGFFGIGLHTLVLFNLIILAAIVFLLFRILELISDRFAATVGCIVFLTVFAVSQYSICGNYNFVSPYRHEMTHGIFLSLLAIYCLYNSILRGALSWLAASGFCLGLVFLTKSEVSMPPIVACSVGWALSIWSTQPRQHPLQKRFLIFSGSAFLPLLLAFGLLLTQMPAKTAFLGVLGTWPLVSEPAFINSPYFRELLGMDEPLANLLRMLGWSAAFGLVFAAFAWLSWTRKFPRKRLREIATVLLLAILGVWLWKYKELPIFEMARPLPLGIFILGAASFFQFLKLRPARLISPSLILRCTMILYAFLLLGKMILNACVYHYGFALAMPATLLLVVAFTCWIPLLLCRQGGDGLLFRVVSSVLVGAFCMTHLVYTHVCLLDKVFMVSQSPDSFYADIRRGSPFDEAVEDIKKRLSPTETLAVFPDGIMLNYLTRRATSIPYLVLNPNEVDLFGEDNLIKALEKHPPDYVALVHKDTTPWGVRFFGKDYATRVYAWIIGHYQPVAVYGETPFESPGKFGVLLLQLKKEPGGDLNSIPKTPKGK